MNTTTPNTQLIRQGFTNTTPPNTQLIRQGFTNTTPPNTQLIRQGFMNTTPPNTQLIRQGFTNTTPQAPADPSGFHLAHKVGLEGAGRVVPLHPLAVAVPELHAVL